MANASNPSISEIFAMANSAARKARPALIKLPANHVNVTEHDGHIWSEVHGPAPIAKPGAHWVSGPIVLEFRDGVQVCVSQTSKITGLGEKAAAELAREVAARRAERDAYHAARAARGEPPIVYVPEGWAH